LNLGEIVPSTARAAIGRNKAAEEEEEAARAEAAAAAEAETGIATDIRDR
jgi:hypothetical protein